MQIIIVSPFAVVSAYRYNNDADSDVAEQQFLCFEITLLIVPLFLPHSIIISIW